MEHPVTEMISGRDLVIEQIRIAAGEPMSFGQNQIDLEGHAIEFRINAEDADRNFLPAPGTLRLWSPAEGAGIRVDTHCYPGYHIPRSMIRCSAS